MCSLKYIQTLALHPTLLRLVANGLRPRDLDTASTLGYIGCNTVTEFRCRCTVIRETMEAVGSSSSRWPLEALSITRLATGHRSTHSIPPPISTRRTGLTTSTTATTMDSITKSWFGKMVNGWGKGDFGDWGEYEISDICVYKLYKSRSYSVCQHIVVLAYGCWCWCIISFIRPLSFCSPASRTVEDNGTGQ